MIKFGTSGWRGIIGEDFTFDNVRIASQGIANYLKKRNLKGSGVVIAYDTRFLSEKFASEAARILAFNDIQAFLCTRDVPTPCASFETVRRKAMGAINFTASHNPPEYNGLKFSTANGAPALPGDHEADRGGDPRRCRDRRTRRRLREGRADRRDRSERPLSQRAEDRRSTSTSSARAGCASPSTRCTARRATTSTTSSSSRASRSRSSTTIATPTSAAFPPSATRRTSASCARS